MPPIFNFKTVRPAVEAGYLGSYVTVPAFSYIGPIWKGVSEKVLQFNYSADRNFVLKFRPIMPANANFVAVIKYRVGMIVYRYKLWGDIGEVLPDILIYTNQVIKKNFVIEIWNIASSNAVSLAEDFNVELGIRNVPDFDYSSLADQEEDAGDLITPESMYSNVLALPTTGLLSKYTAEGWVAGNLEDSVGNFDLTLNGAPVAGPAYVNPNSNNGQFFPIRIGPADYFEGPSAIAGLGGTKYLVCLLTNWNWADGEVLFGLTPVGNNAGQAILRTSSPNVAAKVGAGTFGANFLAAALGEYMVLVLKVTPNVLTTLGLGNNISSQVGMGGLAFPANLKIGEADLYFSDLLVYDSTGDITGAVDYLLNARGFLDAIPTEITGDEAWLDNE